MMTEARKEVILVYPEMGFSGAVRTARRLAAYARSSFVRRYRKYVRR